MSAALQSNSARLPVFRNLPECFFYIVAIRFLRTAQRPNDQRFLQCSQFVNSNNRGQQKSGATPVVYGHIEFILPCLTGYARDEDVRIAGIEPDHRGASPCFLSADEWKIHEDKVAHSICCRRWHPLRRTLFGIVVRSNAPNLRFRSGQAKAKSLEPVSPPEVNSSSRQEPLVFCLLKVA